MNFPFGMDITTGKYVKINWDFPNLILQNLFLVFQYS
jgi:hypothetical protein